MFYQVAILCCAVSAVLSAPTDVVPLEKQQPTVIPIVSQSDELEPNGTYKFSYETGNGIKREEISFDKVIPKAQGRSDASSEGGGSDESDEIHVQQGSYSYTAPDGTVITVRYIADENGFQAFGDHLPRAPAPLQISSSSADKSGRALKSADSAETASAPVPVVKPESKPEPEKTAPEAPQSASEAQPVASEPASAPPVVESRIASDVESKSSEDSALPGPTAPIEATDQSSTIGASEPLTEAAEQSTSAAEQSPVAAEKSTAAAEKSPVAAEQSTVAAEPSTAAPEQITTAAEQSTNAIEQTTAAAEQSTAAAEQSTAAAEQSTAVVEQSSSTDAEESVSAVNTEESVANSAAEDQPSTVADNNLAPVSSDSQPSASTIAEESSVPVNAETETVPPEQSASMLDSEQPASTEAALQSEDAATTPVPV